MARPTTTHKPHHRTTTTPILLAQDAANHVEWAKLPYERYLNALLRSAPEALGTAIGHTQADQIGDNAPPSWLIAHERRQRP
jgi:hypothetical protein